MVLVHTNHYMPGTVGLQRHLVLVRVWDLSYFTGKERAHASEGNGLGFLMSQHGKEVPHLPRALA